MSHKGRLWEQVNRRWLSPDFVVPRFAPKKMIFDGAAGLGPFTLWEIFSDQMAVAAEDPVAFFIRWEGTFTGSHAGTCSFEQRIRHTVPGLRFTLIFDGGDGPNTIVWDPTPQYDWQFSFTLLNNRTSAVFSPMFTGGTADFSVGAVPWF